MNLVIKGRNMTVSEAVAAYADEKIGRLGRQLWDGARCELELWTEKNPSIANNQVAEATIFTKGPVIRGREASSDMYTALDLLAEKLERQVRKYRGKLIARTQGGHREAVMQAGLVVPEEPEAEVEEAGELPRIVKTKQFLVKPMTAEEAALQLELVGHDFFVFQNVETQETNVVYRRADGDYGLIEPQR